jgi:hypothetical protein
MALCFSTVFWNTRLQKDFPVEFKGRLAGARSLMSSLYAGLITLIVSSAHEVSFNAAVGAGMAIALVQTSLLVLFRGRNTSKLALTS